MARNLEEGDDWKKKWGQRTALALGAAGLFLFIVGVKRKHRLDAEREIGDEAPRRGSRGWTDATARHVVEDEDAAD
jgi:hypothetical protein